MSEPQAQAGALSIHDTRVYLAGLAARLPMFVITDHPSDWPDFYVARLNLTLPEPEAADLVIMDRSLERLRVTMSALGGHRLGRAAEDDPVIVETWIM